MALIDIGENITSPAIPIDIGTNIPTTSSIPEISPGTMSAPNQEEVTATPEQIDTTEITQNLDDTFQDELQGEFEPAITVTMSDIPGMEGIDIRNVRNTEKQNIINSNNAMTSVGTPKQNRVLSERQLPEDFVDFKVIQSPTGNSFLRLNATGGVANGQIVGATKPMDVPISRPQVTQAMSALTRYGMAYNSLPPAQKASGGVNTIYGIIRPFLKDSTLPGADEVNSVVNAMNIGFNWDRLSNPGKFIGVANSLVDLSSKMNFKVPSNYTNSLSMLNFGYSAYQLINNWDDMSPTQKGIGVYNTINSGSNAYSAGSALINGANGASGGAIFSYTAGEAAAEQFASSVTASYAADASASVAAADAAASGTTATTGTTAATTGGTLSTVGQYLPYVATALAAYSMVDNYGQGGPEGRASGAMSGATIGANFGPIGFVIGAIVGTAIGSIKAGKSTEQSTRDGLRSHYEKMKIFEKKDSNHYLELADGSFYNVGVDGSDGRAMMSNGEAKTVYNPSRIAERDKGQFAKDAKLRPYEIDYTNDLDFATSLSTRIINLLPLGGSPAKQQTAQATQMNGYFTNAATSNIGSREFTEENFGKAMDNVRGYYEKMGLINKEYARQAIVKAKFEGRLTQDDYNASMLGLEFAFEKDFGRAKALMNELDRGDDPEGEARSASAEDFKALEEADLSTLNENLEA